MDGPTIVGLAVGALLLYGVKTPAVTSATKPKGWPMPDFKLSEHFAFFELTGSSSHPELVEQNRQEAVSYQGALRTLATALLEPIRAHFGVPVIVSSAFRGTTLNKVIAGAGNSQHLVGQAADINVKGVTPDKVFQWIWKESGLPFGQLILEKAGGAQWVHISMGTKREVLTYNSGTYTKLA
jgi:hypothetical protein